jgi:multicomponent Na+:H+ antiporter subunit A
MLVAVFSAFVVAAMAPWIVGWAGDRSGWGLAVFPAALAVYFGSHLPAVAGGESWREAWAWVPALGIDLAVWVDGLSMAFAVVISAVAALVVVYATGYMAGDRQLPRFFAYLFGFMGAMLGVVLSDNLFGVYVFWELTSLSSFLLIGYHHEQSEARSSAHQGLMVTVGGSLAMFAGLILVGMIASDAGVERIYSLSALLELAARRPEAITGHALYTPAVVLVLVGCFTKSAQVPFHFWLPNAMVGPTPVSAFLHSAAMVKAGIYLMARLSPILGGTALWTRVLTEVGAVTMLVAIYFAVKATDYKQVLAYTTITALGVMTMLIGMGTETALRAFVVYLLAHAAYKATLFMVAGNVDHEAGTRELTRLRGLGRAMPVTFGAALVAALSLGGVWPLLGFVGKEIKFEAVLFGEALLVAVIVTSLLSVVVAAAVGWGPYVGERSEAAREAHEAPVAMLVGPVVLAGASLLAFVVLEWVDRWLVVQAVAATFGEAGEPKLKRWHGFDYLPLWLGLGSLVVGLFVYRHLGGIRSAMGRFEWLYRWGPERGYEWGISWLLPWVANRQTRVLQHGRLRNYVATVLVVMVTVVGYPLVRGLGGIEAPSVEAQLHQVVAVAVIVGAAVYAAVTRSRPVAATALTAVGFGVALVYALFSAPDVAITQLLVDTLLVLILLLVIRTLPGAVAVAEQGARLRDVVIAGAVGVLMAAVVAGAGGLELYEPAFGGDTISKGLIEASNTLAHGRNVVNVILVEYRVLDTLGEIFVLAAAAVGMHALVHSQGGERGEERG